jgi:hypothetical protein
MARKKTQKTILVSYRFTNEVVELIKQGVQQCSLSGEYGLYNKNNWTKTDFIVNALVEWQKNHSTIKLSNKK